MKSVWLIAAVGALGLVGCNTTPKREMRPPASEELVSPPPNTYANPPDVPRDQPLLTPKSNGPGVNPGAGMSGMGSPQMGPGAAPGGARR